MLALSLAACAAFAQTAAPPGDPRPPGTLHTGADCVVELPASMQGKGHIALRSFRGAEIRVRREGLDYLVERLAAELHRPVIDKTGLTGQYDYSLAYLPEQMLTARANANPGGQDDRPGVFTALQEQLGLKLEVRKAPAEVLVIDRVEKTPTEN